MGFLLIARVQVVPEVQQLHTLQKQVLRLLPEAGAVDIDRRLVRKLVVEYLGSNRNNEVLPPFSILWSE